MPRIVPIKELKNTGAISQMCSESKEPIYITKNGYGDMVIMSMETYNETMGMFEVYNRIAEAEIDVQNGKLVDAKESLRNIREKHDL